VLVSADLVNEMVSVIIPTRGTRPELLAEAVGSLPDGITLFLAKNEGKSTMHEAMNMALEACETPFVFVMGDDDLIEEDTIRLLLEGIGRGDVAYPRMELFGTKEHEFVADLFCRNRLRHWNFVTGSSLFRVSKLREVGGWRKTPVEDWDLIWRLSQAGARMEPVPEAVYRYRQHGKSLSSDIVDSEMTLGDLIDHMEIEQVPLWATFYGQATRGVGYVRGVLPARYLPGVFRTTLDQTNNHETPVTVWHHPHGVQREFVEEARAGGQRVVVDVDDNYASPAFDRTLRAWGMPGIADDWLKHRDGHRQICREADAVICATMHLADTYTELNDNVHVIPNTVDPYDWAPNPYDPSAPLRVGWAAGRQHGPDAELVEPALRWASKQRGVEVVVIGILPDWDFEFTWVPPTPTLQTYRDWLGVLDIGLAPLKGGALNDCKSDLKMLEYTMAGALTIASCRPAYAQTIRHGETGVLAKNAREFKSYLQHAVRDEDTRLSMVRNASRYVAGCRIASQSADAYRAVLATIGVLEPVKVEA
jgi:hypothetical protein